MNLVFLCKRRPMGRDLMRDPYGRFHYLPTDLANKGHSVRVLLLDYDGGPMHSESHQGVQYRSASISRYRSEINGVVAECRPDVIVGFSDTYFGILAAHYGCKFGIASCIDAYDNYESYLGWARPLHWLWRRALRRASLVTAAGPGLLSLMSEGRQGGHSAVIPMAADPIGFEPLDRSESRRSLGLEPEGQMVGYCGSLHRSRGVDVLFDAIELLRHERSDLKFIHSGRTWKDVPLPESLHSLGFIDEEKIPPLLNSMDTLVVVNRASAFGQHSYPVKLYEAMSCQVPVVASRTIATDWILADHAERLVEPENPEALAAAIKRSLSGIAPSYSNVPTWSSSGSLFEQALLASIKS